MEVTLQIEFSGIGKLLKMVWLFHDTHTSQLQRDQKLFGKLFDLSDSVLQGHPLKTSHKSYSCQQ
jgi:hypothetical protein